MLPSLISVVRDPRLSKHPSLRLFAFEMICVGKKGFWEIKEVRVELRGQLLVF
jgi:hypothetical protein